MTDIDDYLRAIEHKYLYPKSSPNSPPDNAMNQSHQNDNDIDSFLAHLESQKKSFSPPPRDSQIKYDRTTAEKDLLSEIEEKFKQKPSQKTSNQPDLLSEIEKNFQAKKKDNQPTVTSFAEENLKQIANKYQQKQTEIKDQKLNNVEKIRDEELKKQRQKKLMTAKAQKWLKNLDPYSDEGFWFEQFALSYPSRLEAAIEYLLGLQI